MSTVHMFCDPHGDSQFQNFKIWTLNGNSGVCVCVLCACSVCAMSVCVRFVCVPRPGETNFIIILLRIIMIKLSFPKGAAEGRATARG